VGYTERDHLIALVQAGRLMQLATLGATAQGVTFTGTVTELPATGIYHQLGAFLHRWPQAGDHVNADTLANAAAASRLYEITVTSWVLFDENSYPDQPRRPLPANPR
jgi:hypothetical protein